jgi:D-alanyl-D-alanine endopeptidase (penicillin-binding protein 7)
MATLFSMSSTSVIEITKEETNYPPDASNLAAGEKFEARELVYPMLLDSSNIAAEALASSTNRAKFLELMSGYAWEIGMPNTFFADPSGLDFRNVASAKDIFALARYLYAFHPEILALTRTIHLEVATTSGHGAHNFNNIHPFVHDSRFIGGKTGRTPEAGETMLTILDIDGEPIAFIILGSNFGARENDTRILLDKYSKTI